MGPLHYSKKNELKLKYNDKDWDDTELQLTMYHHMDLAKSEGYMDCLESLGKDLDKIFNLRRFKEWLKDNKYAGSPFSDKPRTLKTYTIEDIENKLKEFEL